MTKIRVAIFLITVLVVSTAFFAISLYARGWRINRQTGLFSPNGLLVVKSAPDGAQVFIDGELETATNATIPLPAATYDVNIRKDGFLPWEKRLVIEKEVVTEVTAHLFKSAPSLSAVTLTGSLSPQPSQDTTKIAFVVPPNPSEAINEKDSAGLWIIETLNLPIGFSREPRRITDGNLTDANWIWSPDGREILITATGAVYLLNTGEFTPQSQRINLTDIRRGEIIAEWEDERLTRLEAKMNRLPAQLFDILERRTSAISFSPDEDMILYTASSSAEIPDNLIKQLPGASTQKQEKHIKERQTYVYDIKEDRNFLVYDQEVTLNGLIGNKISWFPTSRHLVLAEPNKITIMDYDGTNRKVVYSGSYVAPHAFSTLSIDRLLILTNLGSNDSLPNLYSLSLK